MALSWESKMFEKRCSLCDGKIVNMRCVDCGLDATKSDESYKLNWSSCDHQPLTHVHEDQDSRAAKRDFKRKQMLNKAQVVRDASLRASKERSADKAYAVRNNIPSNSEYLDGKASGESWVRKVSTTINAGAPDRSRTMGTKTKSQKLILVITFIIVMWGILGGSIDGIINTIKELFQI